MNRENHKDKDLKNTYLWVNREDKYGEKYEEILLYKQSVPELLTFYETEENGEKGLIYVLDFRLSFLESLAGGRMNCSHIESLIKSLVGVMNAIDEYLLDPSNLVLEMEHIYGKDEKWSYVYVPGYGEDFWKQMEKLSEEWLNYVDYESEKAVLWAYTFYQMVHSEGGAIEDLLTILKIEKELPDEKKEEIYITDEKKMAAPPKTETSPKGWRHWLKRKRSQYFKGKERKKGNLDFYEKTNDLDDTCPMLVLPEEYEKDNRNTFALIPLGDSEIATICINKFPVLIGRAPEEVDICLKRLKISRIHARIEEINREIRIVDMSSANGTYRNGERLKPGKEYVLYAGDIIKLADLEFICQWC